MKYFIYKNCRESVEDATSGNEINSIRLNFIHNDSGPDCDSIFTLKVQGTCELS